MDLKYEVTSFKISPSLYYHFCNSSYCFLVAVAILVLVCLGQGLAQAGLKLMILLPLTSKVLGL
jgi:hypothetical protein